jgi:hypothetical protein
VHSGLQQRRKPKETERNMSSIGQLTHERSDKIVFKGYETEQKLTPISNRTTTFIITTSQWSDTIPFFDYFKPVLTVEAPMAYIIPQAWDEVIERMKLNGVVIKPLERDFDNRS